METYENFMFMIQMKIFVIFLTLFFSPAFKAHTTKLEHKTQKQQLGVTSKEGIVCVIKIHQKQEIIKKNHKSDKDKRRRVEILYRILKTRVKVEAASTAAAKQHHHHYF